MEQGNCLMSMKRVVPRSECFASPAFYSFAAAAGLREERAAVEFIWPPRSYSCSFCTREFKSAQALGGHMNVHRRDRERLKQKPPNANHKASSNQILDQNVDGANNPSSTTDKDDNGGILMNLGEGSRKVGGAKGDKNVMEDYRKNDHGEVISTDMLMGLDSEFCQNLASGSSCKRAKKTDVSRLPYYSMLELVLGVLDEPTSSNINRSRDQHEELDLELRLGADPPKSEGELNKTTTIIM